jgi:hypothetical protein
LAIGLQREQHGECRQMRVMMAVMVVAMAAVVMIVVIMRMMVMMTMVVAMVPAVMGATVILRLAFIQLKRLAHTDVVFAHR